MNRSDRFRANLVGGLRDAYRVIENPDGTVTTVTDLPTTIVTVTVNGFTKRVEDYVASPDTLAEFEREIGGGQRFKTLTR